MFSNYESRMKKFRIRSSLAILLAEKDANNKINLFNGNLISRKTNRIVL